MKLLKFMKKYKNSLSEITIKDLVIQNRILSSPLSINSSDRDGCASPKTISFFENLAQNNLGIVTIGGTAVNPQGRNTVNEMWVGDKMHLPALIQLRKSIQKHGAKATLQLSHVGPQGNTKYNEQEVVGSSEYAIPEINIIARSLEINEIENIENDFVKAAIMGWEAGFDFIEFQMAHGYLIHSFLSKYLNKRNDIYGQSEQNRFRIVKNIINKIKIKNKKIRLCARISGDDFVKNGLNIDNLSNLIKFMDLNNFYYYTVTAGIYETAKQKYISIKSGDYWKFAKKLKTITNTTVVAQGGITSIDQGEELLKEGVCDIIGMCQSLIADPKIVTKTISGLENEIYGCVAHLKVGLCHRCRYLKQKDVSFDCITPVSWKPTDYPKKIRNINSEKWKKILTNIDKI